MDEACPCSTAIYHTLGLSSSLLWGNRTVPVQQHLQKVYLTLAAALLVSAAGVYFNLLTGVGSLFSIIGFVVCATWLVSTEPTPFNVNKRCCSSPIHQRSEEFLSPACC